MITSYFYLWSLGEEIFFLDSDPELGDLDDVLDDVSSYPVGLTLACNSPFTGGDSTNVLTVEHIHSVELHLVTLVVWCAEGLLVH